MTTFLSKLVGMNFYRHALEISKIIREKDDPQKPLPLLLVREPENPHDSNAIAVYIKLGHIERTKASILADLYDARDEVDLLDRRNMRVYIPAKAYVDDTGQLNVATEIPGGE